MHRRGVHLTQWPDTRPSRREVHSKDHRFEGSGNSVLGDTTEVRLVCLLEARRQPPVSEKSCQAGLYSVAPQKAIQGIDGLIRSLGVSMRDCC